MDLEDKECKLETLLSLHHLPYIKKIIRETERTTVLKCCPFNKIYYHRERVKIQMLLFTRQLLLSQIPEIFQASSDASLLNG